MIRASSKMHQTTLRFGPDLWAELERAAAEAGVSVAQYVRDAALARVVGGYGASAEHPEEPGERPALREARLENKAVWAQARQARRQAAELRAQSVRLRERDDG